MKSITKQRVLASAAAILICISLYVQKRNVPTLTTINCGGVLAFSSDGKQIACGMSSNRGGSGVRIWDIENQQSIFDIDTGATMTTCVALSPDGNHVATGQRGDGMEGEVPDHVSVWDRKTGKRIARLAVVPRESSAKSLYYSPDGTTLLAGKHDKIYMWDAKNNYRLTREVQTRIGISSVGYNGRMLVIGGHSGKLAAYDMTTLALLPTPPTGMGSIYAVALSADGSTAAASGQEPTIVVWDIKTGNVKMKAVQPGQGSVNAIALSPDGSQMVTSGHGVLLWNTTNGTVQRNLDREATTTSGSYVVFAPNGSAFAASTWAAGHSHLWRLN
jgi:WD40 repeat protein